MTVNILGIVDCDGEKNHLHRYIYDEGEGNKGGCVVASLIMKHLRDRGLLDGTKWKKLSIIMDNCVGQNKNNYVLRLAPYLIRKGYFSTVQFIFLVVGHTKNAADRFFNNENVLPILKCVLYESIGRIMWTTPTSYRKTNVLR